MGLNDALAQATVENAVRVIRAEQKAQSDLLDALQGLGDELGDALITGDPTAPKRTAWKMQRLNNLLAQVHEILTSYSPKILRLVGSQMLQVARDQSEAIPDLINGILKVDLAGVSLTEEQIRAIASDTLIEGAPSRSWWKRMNGTLEHDFAAELRKGMLAGENLADLVKRIRGIEAANGVPAFPGVLGKYRRNAEALVRTSWMTVANATAMASYQANADIMAGVTWLATLDPRTCAVCAELDGQTWGLDEAHPMAPRHWGCRCCLSPRTKSWEQLAREAGGNTSLAKTLDQMPLSTRASMDGQVPAKLSYQEWEAKRQGNAKSEIIKRAKEKAASVEAIQAERRPWGDFPPVDIFASIPDVKSHPQYLEAKTGDLAAAKALVNDFLTPEVISKLEDVSKGKNPLLLGVYALEETGVNRIPAAMSELVAERLGLELTDSVVQINTVGHTGAKGWARMVRQAIFDGEVQRGRNYMLLDDFIGQGGTFANMRGFVEANGGHVIHAVALTGKDYSATLAMQADTLAALREKYDPDFETWWNQTFGFGFPCLTESEGRYLLRAENADTVRSQLAKAGLQALNPGT